MDELRYAPSSARKQTFIIKRGFESTILRSGSKGMLTSPKEKSAESEDKHHLYV